MNIHFICRGNVLRSLVAETYLRSLELDGVTVISSGTNVNWNDKKEQEYFSNTLRLLDGHNIKLYAKERPQQLTQSRIDTNDLTICMNQRVVDEARTIVELPNNTTNWNIIDIGEGHRIIESDKELYEEEIYKEITLKVDELVATYHLDLINQKAPILPA
jgi:protein-tyrosine-phosphatase